MTAGWSIMTPIICPAAGRHSSCRAAERIMSTRRSGPTMKRRVALLVGVIAVYAGAMRAVGQAPGGLGAQGARSSPRDWTNDAAMKITGPFTLASVGDVIIVRPASQLTDPGLQSAIKV